MRGPEEVAGQVGDRDEVHLSTWVWFSMVGSTLVAIFAGVGYTRGLQAASGSSDLNGGGAFVGLAVFLGLWLVLSTIGLVREILLEQKYGKRRS